MHLLITDSGVGGLSVCAYIERFLRTHVMRESVILTYVNAARENDFGYNAMSSREEKLENFDRFLQIVYTTYAPDLIYVACNTLSVLFPDTRFAKTGNVPVRGIVETGGHHLLTVLEQFPRSIAVIFGTGTTIAEGTYAHFLQRHGIQECRIISQACPSLADTISEDRQGLRAKEMIDHYVRVAVSKSQENTNHYLAYLACTHYGYRKVYFASALGGPGVDVTMLNPNELVIEDLFGKSAWVQAENQWENDVEVAFITRYKIPENALETVAFFLGDVSPETVHAFRHYTYAPDLF